MADTKLPATIDRTEVTQSDVFLIGDAEIELNGLVNHQTSTMNDLYNTGMSEIITQNFKIKKNIEFDVKATGVENQKILSVNFEVDFTKVEMENPTTSNLRSRKSNEIIFPKDARRFNKTYCANLYIDAKVKAIANFRDGTTKERTADITKAKIGKMPIMIRSNRCNTYRQPRDALIELKEDPQDAGGYFIVDGVEWSIDCIENNLFNKIRIHNNEGHGKEVFRAEFVSKPGDSYQNQGYLVIRYMNDNQLTCNIVKSKLRYTQIPFYVLFRLLYTESDKKIHEHIVYSKESDVGSSIDKLLQESFNAKYTSLSSAKNIHAVDRIMDLIASDLKNKEFKDLKLDENPANFREAHDILQKEIDLNLFPHIGMTPQSRPLKARFLGLIIRKLFLAKLKLLDTTDRDSFIDKRVHAAGPSYAKPFKSYFNMAIIQKIVTKFSKEFRSTQFSSVNLAQTFKNSINGSDFGRLLLQSITSGNKTELALKGSRRITNRLATQLLPRKSEISTLAAIRQIATTSADSVKQSDRAHEMRRVHPTQFGYVCITHTPEGEKVGINKQLGAFTSISGAASSFVIKEILAKDPLIIPLTPVHPSPADIELSELSNVYVNGDWIGCTADSMGVVSKYRKLRRSEHINSSISIHWDPTQDEVYFWADFGKLMRPLIIVYNTTRDPEKFSPAEIKSKKFRQTILFTADHAAKLKCKQITIHDLVKDGVAEYIAHDEQTNLALCKSYNYLVETQADEMQQWTHCDIPDSQCGITTLTSPYANHNQPARVIFQSNHCKQTCGYYALNWPYRTDRESFLQYNYEMPLVQTIINRYVRPSGNNTIVAIMCYTGYNQEDSLILAKGASERGEYNGCKITYYETTLEQKEVFGNPNSSLTAEIKSANYGKLDVTGFVTKGTEIVKGDIIIGKYMHLGTTAQKAQYIDRSIVYREQETAIVSEVIQGINDYGEVFCKVTLRKIRNSAIGDKFSSRHGQKGVVGFLIRDSHNVRTRDGMMPSIIMNPHAIPSRMTIGQLIECLVSSYCAAKGTHVDGTIFSEIDTFKISEELIKMGYSGAGCHRLYGGITGEPIDCDIFIGPTMYQRLQKFTADAIYAVNKSTSDPVTYQPADGKSSGGGLRAGEMELWCFAASGVSRIQNEKFRDHSDGYIQYICRCGKDAIVNKHYGIYKCLECRDLAMIVKVETTWTAKLLNHELNGMQIGTRRYPEPFKFTNYLT